MQPTRDLPLSRYAVFQTQDLDEARDEVAKIFCPHRLTTVGTSHLDACHHNVDLGGFSLNYVQYGADVDIHPGELGTFFLLQVPLSGQARIRCNKQEVDGCPRQATLLSPSLDVAMRWSEACGKLLVQIPRPAMERTLEAMLGRTLRGAIEFAVGLNLESGAGRRIARMIHLLRDDAESDDPLFARSGAGAPVREMLLTALLNGVRHTYSDALLAPPVGVAPRHVRQAEDYMRAHVAEPLTVSDIATRAGVSTRALQEGFRRFRDSTPLEALHGMRLNGARAALLAGAADESVTSVALRWGFPHLSRFAGVYAARFHELPSETLRQSRAR